MHRNEIAKYFFYKSLEMYIKFYGLHNPIVVDVHRNICIVLIELNLYDRAI
jgi:hypothetical protein